jgi:excisionase family DNA binding protein
MPADPPALPPLLSPADVAAHLGVHPRTVRRITAAGKLAAFRAGPKVLRYRPEDVAAYVASNTTAVSCRGEA